MKTPIVCCEIKGCEKSAIYFIVNLGRSLCEDHYKALTGEWNMNDWLTNMYKWMQDLEVSSHRFIDKYKDRTGEDFHAEITVPKKMFELMSDYADYKTRYAGRGIPHDKSTIEFYSVGGKIFIRKAKENEHEI